MVFGKEVRKTQTGSHAFLGSWLLGQKLSKGLRTETHCIKWDTKDEIWGTGFLGAGPAIARWHSLRAGWAERHRLAVDGGSSGYVDWGKLMSSAPVSSRDYPGYCHEGTFLR